MVDMSFPELARREFGYLADEFGFSTKESFHGPEPLDNGVIEFRSASTILIIRLDRGEIIDRIGPISEPEIGWLSIEKLVEFLTQGKDTSLLDGSMRPQYDFEGWIAYRLARYAMVLRKYCEPILRGDFSNWFEIQKWFLRQMQSEYEAMTGLEFPQNQRYVQYVKSKELDNQ